MHQDLETRSGARLRLAPSTAALLLTLAIGRARPQRRPVSRERTRAAFRNVDPGRGSGLASGKHIEFWATQRRLESDRSHTTPATGTSAEAVPTVRTGRQAPGAAAAAENLRVYDGERMTAESPAYFEIIDFIAAGTTPEAVVQFRPSVEAQQRVGDLIEREKAGSLSSEELAELDHYLELEHILRIAKAKARQILARG